MPRRASSAVACTSLLLSLLASAGCRDSTGPRDDAHVTVSVEKVTAPDLNSVADDGTPLISCTAYLRAIADGHADVVWRGATFYWYAGKDRTTPVDSQPISEAAVAESWGNAQIASFLVQTSGWSLTAGTPFALAIDYRYQAVRGGGPEKHARVTFACGPVVPATASAPTISSLSVTPATGKIQPGDSLTVDYAVSSDVGLWQTALTVSGPCVVTRQFAEQLHPTATHSVKIVLPAECNPGGTLQVNVLAKDAGEQSTFRSVTPTLTLVDERPPQIIVTGSPDRTLTNVVRGDYFLGDTIKLDVAALDNHAVRTIVWDLQPSGDRDSVAISGAVAATTLRLPVRSTWLGPIRLRVYARDAQDLSSDTVASVDGELRVYPTTDRPAATGTINGDVGSGAAFDARRQVVYVVQPNEQRIAVFSLATMQVTSTIPVPGTPIDVELTPSGDSLLFTSSYRQSLGVVDLRQPSPDVTTLPLQGLDPATFSYPRVVRVAANGKALAVLDGGTSSLIEIDLRTGAQHVRADAGRSGSVGYAALATSADRSTVAVGATNGFLQAYDGTTDSFGPLRALSDYDGWPPAVDGSGHRVAAHLEVYDASMQSVSHVHAVAPGAVRGSVLSPDGEYLYYLESRHGVVRARTSDGTVVDCSPVPLPTKPAMMLISPDGTTLVTIENSFTVGTASSKTVTKIDLR